MLHSPLGVLNVKMDIGYFTCFSLFLYFTSALNTNPCSLLESVDISNATEDKNHPNNFQLDGVTYNSSNYFIDEYGKKRGCICNIKRCLRKCCGRKFQMVDDWEQCTATNSSFALKVYSEMKNPKPDMSVDDFFLFIGFNSCLPGYDLLEIESDYMYLQENGSLYYNEQDAEQNEDVIKKMISLEHYCLDLSEDKVTGFFCDEKDRYEEKEELARLVNACAMAVSIPFLFITFVIYLILNEKNVHRRSLMCYVLSVLVAFICMITLLFGTEFSPVPCQLLGHLIVFFFHASFFWLNVMCVDMWLTFSSSIRRVGERRKYIYYSIYAWLSPAAIVLIVLFLNLYTDLEWKFHPGIGNGKCFLKDGLPAFWYFYFPMAVIITVNIVLFSLTSLKIFNIKSQTKMLKRTDSQIHSSEENKQKFNLYLKLMLAMGLNWSMEFISFVVRWVYGKDAPNEIFYATDAANALYGFIIFLIFVFKKKTWKSLQKRFYQLTGRPHLAHVTSARSTRTSGYSTETVDSVDYHPTISPKNSLSEEIPLYNK